MFAHLLSEFSAWYLAPWRRIPRWEFGLALTIVTLPGFIFSLVGFGSTVGSFAEPLMGLFGAGQSAHQALRGGDFGALQQNLGSLSSLLPTGTPAAPVPTSFNWSALINTTLLLTLIPICRMRLHDIGHFGKPEIALTILFNVSAVNDFINALSGFNVLPMATLFGFCNFAGYAWLCMAPTKVRERPTLPPPPHTLTGSPPYDAL